MEDEDRGPSGLLQNARRIASSVLEALETRLELLSVEFKEEKAWLLQLLVWASMTIFLMVASTIMITLTVLFAFWDNPETRVPALVIVTLVYVALAVTGFFRLKVLVKDRPVPFSETIDQLKKDKQCLKN
jgi:uncharacterized membrane protein YqjE